MSAELETASTASAGPPLAEPCHLTGQQLRSWVEACADQGEVGLRSTAALMRLPPEAWSRLLPLVFAHTPNVAGWQMALVRCWAESSSSVLRAAREDRETVRAWFAHADFATPRLHVVRWLIVSAPPATIVYRVGQGDPDGLAKGYSRTPVKAEAAFVAFTQIIRAGPPVIIRRRVTGAEIALQLNANSRETVVIDPGFDAVVRVTPEDKRKLLERLRRLQQRPEPWVAKLEGMSDAEVMAGWTGESPA